MSNGCAWLPTHTFSRGTCRSTLDYILYNPVAIDMFSSCHFTEPLLGAQGDGVPPVWRLTLDWLSLWQPLQPLRSNRIGGVLLPLLGGYRGTAMPGDCTLLHLSFCLA